MRLARLFFTMFFSSFGLFSNFSWSQELPAGNLIVMTACEIAHGHSIDEVVTVARAIDYSADGAPNAVFYRTPVSGSDFSENWAYRFQTVVDELCNNAIEHGSEADSYIKITFIAVPDKHIKIKVEDFGKKENPITAKQIEEKNLKTQKTDIKDLGLRGRGLALIVSKWTDKLEIKDTKDGGHIVEITKNLNDQTFKTLERSLEPNQIII